MDVELFKGYLILLDLKPGYTLKDLKQAYHNHIQFFHPDRYSNPILKRVADEKTKEINAALIFLKKNVHHQIGIQPKNDHRNIVRAKQSINAITSKWNVDVFESSNLFVFSMFIVLLALLTVFILLVFDWF